ncbi:molybdopterin-dependent oxidoreductase [Pseudonocardia sp.]|uniref:molybdopterin-dependent oxidoreductase n=1 Tax=Pseudonocardia sp. TaxID=60912 RepID=UPI0026064A1F|nr:molybdopterin-dependent oxidoreductase [Pseudonocardia sp.]
MRFPYATLGRGLLAGLVAGLLLTTVQGIARLWLGVAPPAELLGDRIAPLLTIDQFFGLFGVFGGYNGLKQAGILRGTGGQLAVGVVIAVAVALVIRRSARRGYRLLAILTVAFYAAAVAVLWPILGTNHTGFAPGTGRVVSLAAMAVGFGLFGVAVGVGLRVLGGVAGPAAVPEREMVTAGGGTPPASGGSAEPGGGDERGARDGSGAPAVGRRALLGGVGVGVVGVGLAASTGALGTALYDRSTFPYDGLRVTGPGITPITPNDAFYTVTKNVVDPRVDAGRWSFGVGGAVRTPATYDLAALTRMPETTQETTLMCISNGVGDGLMSNALWTGVPLADLLTAAGPVDDAVEVVLTAVDGYTDTFSIEKALDPTTMLAYRMNGDELPQRHGFPVRLVVPGLYGEKNLKWITRVDVVTYDAEGFYETQGWGPDFVIPTRSTITEPPPAQVSRGSVVGLRGTAFGGDRGVSRVEVSTDDGRTWTDATITYPGTRLSWALWGFDWRPATAGASAVLVRATDGAGGSQIVTDRGIVPTGATGLHRVPVTVL